MGTPQIREQGTIGGNLCQRPRCWYFRSDIQCLKKGGTSCYAVTGENQYHAIFGGGPCFFVHPSDVAVALVALQAQISIAGPAGNKAVKIENFFVSPKKTVGKENVLLPGEIVTDIQDSACERDGKKLIPKNRGARILGFCPGQRCGCASRLKATVCARRGLCSAELGPYPWRVEAAEKLVVGKKLDSAMAAAAAEAAVSGAMPLRDNAYKLDMVRGAVEESLMAFI